MSEIRNLYGIEDPKKLEDTIKEDIRHFIRHHTFYPTSVRIHPRFISGQTEIHGLKVVPDEMQPGASYSIIWESEQKK
jgi:hypothetical protein